MAVKVEVTFEMIDKISNELKDVKSSVDKLGKSRLTKLTDSFTKIGVGITAVNQGFQLLKSSVTAAAGFVNKFVTAARKVEDLETQFTVLTKSSETAKQTIQDLQEFSARTPFQLQNLAEASTQLLAFGFQTEELLPILQNLGDVAAGSGTDIKELSLIFGQVQAAGKLTGERLLQLQERGIPILDALANEMGVVKSEVRDLVAKGAVDFETFAKTFRGLSSESGLFFEGMIRQSKTLSGVLSTLSDNVELLFADIGKTFLPIIKEAALTIITLIQANKDLIRVKVVEFVSGAIKAFGSFLEILGKLAPAFFVLLNPIDLAQKAILALSKKFAEAIISIAQFANKLPGVNIKLDTMKFIVKDLKKQIEENDKELMESAENIDEFSKFMKKSATVTKAFSDEVKELGKNVNKLPKKKTVKVDVKTTTEDTGAMSQIKSFVDRLSKSFKKLITETGGGVGGAIGAAAGVIGAGEAGAQQLIGMAGDAIAPGVGQALKFFSVDQEQFKQQVEGFLTALEEIPTRLAENLPYFIDALIEHLPRIIEAWNELTPLLIENLSVLLSDPAFWEKVTKAQIKVWTIQFSDPLMWQRISIRITKSFIDQIPEIARAMKDAIVEELKGIGGNITGGASDVLGSVGGFFGFQNGFDVPDVPKYANDGFGPVMLNAGEPVLRAKTSDRLDNMLDAFEGGALGGPKTIVNKLVIGEQELSDILVSLEQKGFRTNAA